jgi:threonine synthase
LRGADSAVYPAHAGADVGLNSFKLCLKLELLQHSGSFKARGAFANLLMARCLRQVWLAASAGNHGAAVAYAARKLNKRQKSSFQASRLRPRYAHPRVWC